MNCTCMIIAFQDMGFSYLECTKRISRTETSYRNDHEVKKKIENEGERDGDSRGEICRDKMKKV